jgi:hypothetical protein
LQIDVYKRQISELHAKLEVENNRADKSDFETKRLLEKTEALSVERDRLQTERDTLKETNTELQDQVTIQYQIHRQCYSPVIYFQSFP